PMLPKRVWRAAKRIGEERIEERRAAAVEYEQLSLPKVAEALARHSTITSTTDRNTHLGMGDLVEAVGRLSGMAMKAATQRGGQSCFSLTIRHWSVSLEEQSFVATRHGLTRQSNAIDVRSSCRS
ncbi:MAG: hypothetical protein WD875_11390, partial [Pirellulales bacterium]